MTERPGHAAVVTGSAHGIGFAVAQRLALSGMPVVIADIDGDAAREAVATITALGGTSQAAPVNVSDEQAVVQLADETEANFGPIGVWINNAGAIRPAMLHKMEVDDFDRIVAVHARGTFLGMREAARRMMASQTAGSIINVTSAAGLNGTIGQINYAAAKGAITAMTKSAARELGRHGIRVNAVAPVAATQMTETIRTDPKFSEKYLEKIPLGRWADADEVADAFVFLTTSAASYITGQVLCVDGGTYMAS